MSAATADGTASATVSHQTYPLRVTRDLDGTDITIWVHEITGTRPGPTLGLIGTQHGDEWLTVSTLRATVEALVAEDFAGTVLVVPVANPVAFRIGQRLTQAESDEPDMNRVWPGNFTWITDMLAKALVPTVQRCDAIVDLHFGQWGVLMANTWWSDDVEDPELRDLGRDLSIAFGTSVQQRHGLRHPGSGTLAAYAGQTLRIPCISGGIGGAGFGDSQEREWIDANVRGIFNIMTRLDMRAAPMKLPEQQLHFQKTVRVHPSVGGLLMPDPDLSTLLPRVEAGQVLGSIVCPQTFEVLEALEAPAGGWLYWSARSYPVRPGCFAFGLADEATAEWVGNGG